MIVCQLPNLFPLRLRALGHKRDRGIERIDQFCLGFRLNRVCRQFARFKRAISFGDNTATLGQVQAKALNFS